MKSAALDSTRVPARGAAASVPGGEEGAFWGEEGGPPPAEGGAGPFQAMEGVSAHKGLPRPELGAGGPHQDPPAATSVPVTGGAQTPRCPQGLPGEGRHSHGFPRAG